MLVVKVQVLLFVFSQLEMLGDRLWAAKAAGEVATQRAPGLRGPKRKL